MWNFVVVPTIAQVNHNTAKLSFKLSFQSCRWVHERRVLTSTWLTPRRTWEEAIGSAKHVVAPVANGARLARCVLLRMIPGEHCSLHPNPSQLQTRASPIRRNCRPPRATGRASSTYTDTHYMNQSAAVRRSSRWMILASRTCKYCGSARGTFNIHLVIETVWVHSIPQNTARTHPGRAHPLPSALTFGALSQSATLKYLVQVQDMCASPLGAPIPHGLVLCYRGCSLKIRLQVSFIRAALISASILRLT